MNTLKKIALFSVLIVIAGFFSSCNKESDRFEDITVLAEKDISPELRSTLEQTRASCCWCTD